MATVCGGKKHAGKAFEQVLQEDRGYVAWAVGELQARPENTNGWVKDLAEFGVANGVEAKVGNPPMHRLQAAVQPGTHPCSPSYTPKYPTQPPPLRRGATGAAPPVAQYAIAPDGEAKPPSDVTNGAGKRERDPFMGDPPLAAKVQRNANEPSFACPMVCEMVGGLSPISASANELYASIQRGAPPKERVIDFRAYWSAQVRRAFERHSQSGFRVLDCDLEDRSMPGFDRASHDMRRAGAIQDQVDQQHVLNGCCQRLRDADHAFRTCVLAGENPFAAPAPAPAAEPAGQPAGQPAWWHKCHNWTVGNMTYNAEWTGKRFEDVYNNAPLKAWQWMLKVQPNGSAKWVPQFVEYARARAAHDGRVIEPDAKPN